MITQQTNSTQIVVRMQQSKGHINTSLDKEDLQSLGWEVDHISNNTKDMKLRYDNGDVDAIIEVENSLFTNSYEPVVVADSLEELGGMEGLHELIRYAILNGLIQSIEE